MKTPPPKSKLNLSWGHPEVFADYWSKAELNLEAATPSQFRYYHSSMTNLKELIKKLHKKVGNCDTKDKFIVIGNGATQVLNAVIAVLNKPVTAKAPHFPRFKDFATINKLAFNDPNQSDVTNIITLPNNPDMTLQLPLQSDIIDGCYNWPHYTDNVQMIQSQIAIFNLSKCTGHASLRIGWAVVDNKELANKIEEHIKLQTDGVSLLSQVRAIDIIKHLFKTNFECFDVIKSILKSRWERLLQLNILDFKLLNSEGQFAWCKGKPSDDIEVISGEDFGMTNEYFRMNLAVNDSTFEELLKLYDHQP